MLEHVKLFLKGFLLGATFMLPGVSGAIIAIMLGMYDKMIIALSNLKNDFKTNAKYLIPIGLGGVVGLVSMANLVAAIITYFNDFMMFFLLGSIIGAFPLMVKKSQVKEFKIRYILYVLIGLTIILSLRLLPDFNVDYTRISLTKILFLSVAGLLLAAAIILPGLGTMAILEALGIYETAVSAIGDLYLPFLIPMGIFTILAIALTIRGLEKALTMHPKVTYLIIIGLMFGSAIEVYPGTPKTTLSIILSIVMFIIGIVTITFFTIMLNKKESKEQLLKE